MEKGVHDGDFRILVTPSGLLDEALKFHVPFRSPREARGLRGGPGSRSTAASAMSGRIEGADPAPLRMLRSSVEEAVGERSDTVSSHPLSSAMCEIADTHSKGV